MNLSLPQILQRAPVIPEIVLHDLARAVPLADALVAGGLPVLEVTLRTPVALAAVLVRHGRGHIEGSEGIARPAGAGKLGADGPEGPQLHRQGSDLRGRTFQSRQRLVSLRSGRRRASTRSGRALSAIVVPNCAPITEPSSSRPARIRSTALVVSA